MTTVIKRSEQTRLQRTAQIVHNEILDAAMASASLLVAHKGSNKTRAAVWSVSAARAFVSMAMVRSQIKRDRENSSVTLSSDDHLYGAVQIWLAANISRTSHNNFAATLAQGGKIVYSQSEKGVLQVTHNGVPITINNGAGAAAPGSKGDDVAVSADDDDDTFSSKVMKSYAPKKMTLASKDMAAIESFLSMVIEALREVARQPKLMVTQRWGGWRNESGTPPRTLESVVLEEGLLPGIVEDMADFLAQEDRYVQLGIPYHRGYLFHGPPGTGKTSLARALGTHFKADIYHITLSTVDDDGQLMDYLHRITPGSILLIEDIDAAGVEVKERDSDDDDSDAPKGVTLTGLLNALDGLGTPHGLITIMTTNFPEKLDSALTREGRIDMSVRIGKSDPEQTSGLIEQFTGVRIDPVWIPFQLAPSAVVEIVKKTFKMTDPFEIEKFLMKSIVALPGKAEIDTPTAPDNTAMAWELRS